MNKSKQKKENTKKKEKQVIVPIKGVFGDATDYRIYEMRPNDRVVGFMIAFAVAFVVVMVFFRSVIFSIIAGIAAGILFQKPYRSYLRDKRSKRLLNEFRSLLESLATSYSSGKNTQGAFEDAYNDLNGIYGDDADIVKEAKIIVGGLHNNFNIEELLRNFADRSGIEDIGSFADVFEVSFRQGANINRIIGSTRDIINDKIGVEMDIESALAGGKNELNIMMIMPVIIFLGLSGLGSDMTIISNTPLNVIVKVIALGVFVAAYIIGRRIVTVKL